MEMMERNPQWLKKPETEGEFFELLRNKMWRLHNLYYIVNEYGEKVLFQPRDIQLDFLLNRHGLDIVLKARQLGFSTMIQIDMLDECLFNKNTSGAIVAQSLNDCQEIFRTKIKHAYDHLPKPIRERIYPKSDSKVTLELSNGSIIRVGTSLRSSTNQILHISEYGKICAKYPEKANEIRTGALNTVHVGQKITIESTAEGREGDFYRICSEAENKKISGKDLTNLDFRFHFYPWWEDKKYQIDPTNIVIPHDMQEYFYKLEADNNIELTDAQKAWYVKKEQTQHEEMKREFPSTSKEAFEQAIEGAYFAKQMADARKQGRIGKVPFDPNVPVNTFWDIGMNDSTAIWFHQRVGLENRFIHYYENSGEYFPHYVKYIQNADFIQGTHYFPHDAKNQRVESTDGSIFEQACRLLSGEIVVGNRVPHKLDAINQARTVFYSCYFDEGQCKIGIKHLDSYRKDWNEHLGVWRNRPLHDQASHGADAFMEFAMQYNPELDSNLAQAEYDYYENHQYEDARDENSGY